MAGKSCSLEGRVAIVTGASRGIGREIALQLAEKGAKVVINFVGNGDKAEEVAALINVNDGTVIKAITCKGDVSEAADVANLFHTAEEAFGRVHILVNSAGVLDPSFPTLADTSEEAWERTFAVNCKGAFLCSREAANRLACDGGGRIINITSSAVGIATVGYGAYSATKAAVETMTKILARELRGTQITANCVAPGSVATDMFFAGKSDATIAAIVEQIPFQRLGEVSDVAPLVAFLASDEGEWVNGHVLLVNGGLV